MRVSCTCEKVSSIQRHMLEFQRNMCFIIRSMYFPWRPAVILSRQGQTRPHFCTIYNGSVLQTHRKMCSTGLPADKICLTSFGNLHHIIQKNSYHDKVLLSR